jgi:PAT family beta-lactamase induction signal transducer AmpG
LVDRFGSRRQWITPCLILMAGLLACLPEFEVTRASLWIWVVLLAFTTASATQDVAIDAYTIGLLRPGEEGAANGVRVSAYRVALIVGGGGLLLLERVWGWTGVFWAAAVMCGLLAAAVWAAPAVELPPAPVQGWFAPLRAWVRRPGAAAVVLFVLTYKLGDAAMGPMVKPFWVDQGLSLEEIGLISTGVGVVANVIGALIGGALTSRWGIFRALWVLGLLQALSNLGYAGAAAGGGGRPAVYAASIVESFTGGLGTAAFLAFLMHICDKRQAATEYALLSALFGLTRSLAGGVSGWGAAQLGYGAYFALTFALAFPAYALLPWVRQWIHVPARRSGVPPLSP